MEVGGTVTVCTTLVLGASCWDRGISAEMGVSYSQKATLWPGQLGPALAA